MSPKSPKSEGVAPSPAIKSTKRRAPLNTYIEFLAILGRSKELTSCCNLSPECLASNMAAVFDHADPASPLAYDASQTALLLMDFQGFTVNRCGANGKAVLAKGKAMRDWALAERVMVIHSLVDVNGKPRATRKGAERINRMLDGVANDRDAAEEPTDISFGKRDGEYIVLKHPGFVSGLKSSGITELLVEHGIKSLVLCGISTSGCVLTTALAASDEEFVVSVIQDACTDPIEELHEMLIKTVLPSKTNVATAEEFIREWGSVER